MFRLTLSHAEQKDICTRLNRFKHHHFTGASGKSCGEAKSARVANHRVVSSSSCSPLTGLLEAGGTSHCICRWHVGVRSGQQWVCRSAVDKTMEVEGDFRTTYKYNHVHELTTHQRGITKLCSLWKKKSLPVPTFLSSSLSLLKATFHQPYPISFQRSYSSISCKKRKQTTVFTYPALWNRKS